MKLSIIVFFASLSAFSQNILPGDSDFETGPSSIIAASYNGSIRWSIDNSTRANGQNSLKINFTEKTSVTSRLLPLEGGEYTLSFYAKSSVDDLILSAGILRPWNSSFAQNLKLTKEWKRYFVKGQIQNGYCWITLESRSLATVWIDSVQLEKGSNLTEYSPSKPLYAGIYIPGDDDRIFFTGQKIPLILTVVDTEKRMSEAVVNFKINDTFGKAVKKERKTVKLDSNGRWTENIDFLPEKHGFYYIEVAAQVGDKTSDPFSLSAAVVANPYMKVSEPFLGLDGVGWKRAGLSRIGCKWLEIPVNWSNIEKTKGKYSWNFTDSIITLKEAGFNIKVLIIGVPEWAWDQRDVKELKKSKFKVNSDLSLLPSEDGFAAFKTFLENLSARYKNHVDMWEIGAEDDLAWGRNAFYTSKYSDCINNSFVSGEFPARVAKIYNTGIDAIRSVIPNAKIGIIRPSGVDCTSKEYSFTKSALRYVDRKFDYLPLDPYCYPRYLGLGEPPSEQPESFLQDDLEKAFKTTTEFARGQDIYVSELGYAINAGEPLYNKYHLDLAGRMLKSIVIARSNPHVKMFNWFVIQGGVESGKARYNMWWDDNPAIAVPAFSTAAQLVEGVRKTAELQLGENLKGYAFEKENEASAVLWASDEAGKITLEPLPGLKVKDFCGGEMSGGKTYEINQYPLIFSLKGSNAFDNMQILFAKTEYNFSPIKMSLFTPDKNNAQLIIKNNTSNPQKLTVSAIVSGKEISKTDIDIPADKNSENRVRILLPQEKESFQLEVIAKTGNSANETRKSYDLSFLPLKHIDKPIKIDGKLDDWDEKYLSKIFEGRVEINPPDPHIPYFGNNDLSAKVYCGWDNNNLYIAAIVKDDVQANSSCGWKIWDGDCLQIAIDTKADAVLNKKVAYDSNDFEFGAAVNSKGMKEFYVWSGKNKEKLYSMNKSAILRDEKNKTTVYELSIPWKSINTESEPGTVIGLNYAILDDDDGSGAAYWYQLSPGTAGGGKNPAAFKKFYLQR